MALGAVDMPDSDHGLIGERTKAAEFRQITGKEDPYSPTKKPLLYDEDIDHDELTREEVKMAEVMHLKLHTLWLICKGALAGVGEQIRAALDKKGYKRLEKKIIGYKKVTVCEYFEHLNKKWCPLEIPVIKQLKADFYREWKRRDEDEDLRTFA